MQFFFLKKEIRNIWWPRTQFCTLICHAFPSFRLTMVVLTNFLLFEIRTWLAKNSSYQRSTPIFHRLERTSFLLIVFVLQTVVRFVKTSTAFPFVDGKYMDQYMVPSCLYRALTYSTYLYFICSVIFTTHRGTIYFHSFYFPSVLFCLNLNFICLIF